jgi:hypothetical protein
MEFKPVNKTLIIPSNMKLFTKPTNRSSSTPAARRGYPCMFVFFVVGVYNLWVGVPGTAGPEYDKDSDSEPLFPTNLLSHGMEKMNPAISFYINNRYNTILS